MIRILILAVLVMMIVLKANCQFALVFDPSVPVIRDGQTLTMAWGGGLNFVQLSDIDLDSDGDEDLFLFDRSGNKPIMLLNNGTPGTAGYAQTHAYDDVYPFHELAEWALLRDYDGDGKKDLFAAVNAGFSVYRNSSTGGNLAFELIDGLVGSDYVPTYSPNINTYGIDTPGFEDIDSDGDLDLLTFGYGNQIDFHSNQSMEVYGNADSVIYQVHNRCWGYFSESGSSSAITLNNICGFNVPDPEFPVLGDGEVYSRNSADVGSTLLPLDLDGDGDKDLLVGDVQSRNIIGLTNGGSVDSAYMVSQDPHFPEYDSPIELDRFVATFYEDVDNDGKRDLVAAPSYPGYSENFESLWYYKNNGTNPAPVFAKQQEDLFQDRMLDLGEGAWPVPFDLDGDGLMDLIVANYGYYAEGGLFAGKLAALRNMGSINSPAFTLVTDNYSGLDSSGIGNAMYPAFGDIDNDGDKDMYIGDLNGKLHFYRNISTSPEAQFELEVAAIVDTSNAVIDVGQFAAPQLFDVDGDDLLDLLVGERNGNLNWLRNVGTSNEPVWALANDSLGGFHVGNSWSPTGYSTPFMYLNSSGERELLLGTEIGWISHFENIDGHLYDAWTPSDSIWQNIDEGGRTGVALFDYTGDGYLDAVIGNYRGGLSFWRNDFAIAIDELPSSSAADVFSIVPNPASQSVRIELIVPSIGTLRLELFDDQGRLLSSQNANAEHLLIELGGLAPGSYQARLSMGSSSWTERLVVIR